MENVHEPFGEAMPSLSQAGSQSVQRTTDPAAFASTSNSAKHAVEAFVPPGIRAAPAGQASATGASATEDTRRITAREMPSSSQRARSERSGFISQGGIRFRPQWYYLGMLC